MELLVGIVLAVQTEVVKVLVLAVVVVVVDIHLLALLRRVWLHLKSELL